MTDAPDLLVTGIALAATLVALASVRRAGGATAVASRLAALLGGLALLLAARLLAWTGSAVGAIPLMIVAAWLPLLALLVAEQLVRRHAGAWLKWSALAGAVIFSILTVVLGAVWDGGVLALLAVFQALATIAVAGHLLRQRGDVTPAEARLAAMFAVVLLAAVPLTASDFRAFAALPIRGGAFAAFLLVLAVTRFVAGTATWRALAIDVAATIGGGALLAVGGVLVWSEAPTAALIQLAGVGAATTAFALIVQRRGEARLAGRPTLIPALAALPDDPALDDLLAAHPLLATGRPIATADLTAYPPALMAELATHRVVTCEAGPGERDLLDAQAATHLVRLRRDPPYFLAVFAGGLAGEGTADELDIVARLAEGAR